MHDYETLERLRRELREYADELNRQHGAEARARREFSGLSLREVARRMKISAPHLSDLELGRKPWREELATRFLIAVNNKPEGGAG